MKNAPIIDYSALSINDQEKAYRLVRQRGERNRSISVKCLFMLDIRVRAFVESNLWQTEDYFCLAA